MDNRHRQKSFEGHEHPRRSHSKFGAENGGHCKFHDPHECIPRPPDLPPHQLFSGLDVFPGCFSGQPFGTQLPRQGPGLGRRRQRATSQSVVGRPQRFKARDVFSFDEDYGRALDDGSYGTEFDDLDGDGSIMESFHEAIQYARKENMDTLRQNIDDVAKSPNDETIEFILKTLGNTIERVKSNEEITKAHMDAIVQSLDTGRSNAEILVSHNSRWDGREKRLDSYHDKIDRHSQILKDQANDLEKLHELVATHLELFNFVTKDIADGGLRLDALEHSAKDCEMRLAATKKDVEAQGKQRRLNKESTPSSSPASWFTRATPAPANKERFHWQKNAAVSERASRPYTSGSTGRAQGNAGDISPGSRVRPGALAAARRSHSPPGGIAHLRPRKRVPPASQPPRLVGKARKSKKAQREGISTCSQKQSQRPTDYSTESEYDTDAYAGTTSDEYEYRVLEV
jgi:hypothetical protein